MTNNDIALRIAKYAFSSKKDLAGRPYLEHLERVAANVSDDLYIPALLHDLLEDCPEWTRESLSAIFPTNTVWVISVLTRVKGEKYEDYILRVKQDYEAKKIKLADLKDNMDLCRLSELTDKDFSRLAKYHSAYKVLTNQ